MPRQQARQNWDARRGCEAGQGRAARALRTQGRAEGLPPGMVVIWYHLLQEVPARSLLDARLVSRPWAGGDRERGGLKKIVS